MKWWCRAAVTGKGSKVISTENWDGESHLTSGGGFRAGPSFPLSLDWQESSFAASELQALSPQLNIQIKEEALSSSFFPGLGEESSVWITHGVVETDHIGL